MIKEENKIFKNLYNDFGWEIENSVKRNEKSNKIIDRLQNELQELLEDTPSLVESI